MYAACFVRWRSCTIVCKVYHPHRFIHNASESGALLASLYMVCTFATFIDPHPISQCAAGGAYPCSGGSTSTSSTTNGTPVPASRQVLRFPNVGISDSASLDPALGPDANTAQIVSMVYSGLVRSD